MSLPLPHGSADEVSTARAVGTSLREGSRWHWDPAADALILAAHAESTERPVTLTAAQLATVMPELDVRRLRRALRAMHDDISDTFTLASTVAQDSGPRPIVIRGRREVAEGRTQIAGTIEDGHTTRTLSAQTLLDLMPGNAAVLDERGRIVSVNANWLEFARRRNAERDWIGVDYLAPCVAAARDEPLAAEVVEGLGALLAGDRRELKVEYPCHHEHTKAWYRLRAVATDGAEGRQIVVHHEDVTEQVVTRLEAVRSREELHATEQITHTGSFEEHADGRIDATPALVSLLTRKRLERFRDIASALPTSDRRAFGEARRLAWHGERSSVEHGLHGARAGTHFSPVVVAGAVTSVRGTVHCDTAPDEVRALRARLSGVTESMSECICSVDREGRVVDLNAAAARLLRYRRDELLGYNLADAVAAPDEQAARPSAFARALSAKQNCAAREGLFVRSDGVEISVSYAISHHRENDKSYSTVVFSDISERNERERIHDGQLANDKWTRRVRDALRDDRFVLWAQPIVEIASGNTVKHELLIRMRGTDDRLLEPASFLPAAEASGLIRDVDIWVTRQATALAANGHAVHFNLSAASVCHKDTTQIVEQAIATSGADPRLLVIELTETAILTDERAAHSFAERIADLGIRLALDDFGTGYGGFTYLKHLPISTIKIDREFVRDLHTSDASLHVVEATAQLARSFGIETVAEGVETQPVLDLLRTCGIDYAQGYLFSRPRPLSEVFS